MPVSQYNYQISKIFSAGLLAGLRSSEFENSAKTLLVESGIFPKQHVWDFSLAITFAYEHLKRYYRCEYVYKNEIANQLLLKRHRDNSAALLSEFNVKRSIADIVIVNGVTSAYEIKTELDNLGRLSSQIQDYSQVFDNVSVVTHPQALGQLKKILPSHVGIIILRENGKLFAERNPANNDNEFNREIASRAIRQSDLIDAYNHYEGSLPDVGTAYIGTTCRKWFCSLEIPVAKQIFKDALKSRRPSMIHFNLIKNSPHPLKMALLSRDVSKKTCKIIGDKLNIIL